MGIFSRATDPASEWAPQAAIDREDEIRTPNALASVPDIAAGTKTLPNADVIDDEWFITNLKQLRALSTYVVHEGIHVEVKDGVDPLDLRTLNRLRAPRGPSERGRSPKNMEWEAVDLHRRLLFGSLSTAQRRRFSLSTVPAVLAWLPLVLGCVAFLSMIFAVVTAQHPISAGTGVFIFYLIWLMSLGAIGSITFIGLYVLSAQEDVSFDIANWQLIVLRIELGALFALVLTLPFGFQAFMDFCADIRAAIGHAAQVLATAQSATAPTMAGQTATGESWGRWTEALTLVAPFMFGFGTSLVSLVLNRMITQNRPTERVAWAPVRAQRESTGMSALHAKKVLPVNSSVAGSASPVAAKPRNGRRNSRHE